MKEKRKKAAALQYDKETDSAPRVVAKGSGIIADRILQLAKEHHIPIKEDSQLVEVLAQLDLNQEIPPELYRAVAEILAFIYKTTKQPQ
jgi:flagellar biosynthesis protein